MKKDFKYILSRVLIGVLVGFILFCLKSCKVNALSFQSAMIGSAKTTYIIDRCDVTGSNLICIEDSSMSFVWQFNNTNSNYIYGTSKSFDTANHGYMVRGIVIEFTPVSPVTLTSYRRLFFGGYNITSTRYESSTYYPYLNRLFGLPYQYQSTSYSNLNNFLPYGIQYKLDGSNEYTDMTTIGVITYENKINFTTENVPNNSTISSFKIYYGSPSSYSGAYKTLDNGAIMPDYNYVANSNTTFRLKKSLTDLVNNKYGLYYYPKGSTLNSSGYDVIPKNGIWLNMGKRGSDRYDFTAVSLTSSEMSNSDYYGSYSLQSLDSVESSSIAQSNFDYDVSLLGTLSEEPSDTNSSQSTTDYWAQTMNSAYERITNNTYATRFQNLFSSIFTYPLDKLSEEKDIGLTRINLNGDRVLSPCVCGGCGITGEYNNNLDIHLWRDYSFKFPCMHYDVYSNLKYGNYAFYPSQYGGATHNFYNIYKIILDGILVYLLFVQVLNFYKYIIEPMNTEVEVLEL